MKTRFYAKKRDGKFLCKPSGHVRVFATYVSACGALDWREADNGEPFVSSIEEQDSGITYRTVRHRS